MDHSVLSLQASFERGSLVRRFYLRAGFISPDNLADDNGLSHTSPAFQEEVRIHPELWIQPKKQAMSFFQLFRGWIIFPKVIFSEEQMDAIVANTQQKPDWMSFTYANFPCDKLFMRIIEGYIDSRPILKWLSGEPLPVTDRPLFYTKSVSYTHLTLPTTILV